MQNRCEYSDLFPTLIKAHEAATEDRTRSRSQIEKHAFRRGSCSRRAARGPAESLHYSAPDYSESVVAVALRTACSLSEHCLNA